MAKLAAKVRGSMENTKGPWTATECTALATVVLAAMAAKLTKRRMDQEMLNAATFSTVLSYMSIVVASKPEHMDEINKAMPPAFVVITNKIRDHRGLVDDKSKSKPPSVSSDLEESSDSSDLEESSDSSDLESEEPVAGRGMIFTMQPARLFKRDFMWSSVPSVGPSFQRVNNDIHLLAQRALKEAQRNAALATISANNKGIAIGHLHEEMNLMKKQAASTSVPIIADGAAKNIAIMQQEVDKLTASLAIANSAKAAAELEVRTICWLGFCWSFVGVSALLILIYLQAQRIVSEERKQVLELSKAVQELQNKNVAAALNSARMTSNSNSADVTALIGRLHQSLDNGPRPSTRHQNKPESEEREKQRRFTVFEKFCKATSHLAAAAAAE